MPARRPRSLDAYLHGHPVGTFTLDPQLQFTYHPGHLTADATPLSLSMPLSDTVYRQSVTVPWLDGLLPDSQDVRNRWGTQFGVSGNSAFALLTHMGLDAPGAIQLVPAGTPLPRHGELEPMDEAAIGRRLHALGDEPDRWTFTGERWSLGGAQSKFALRWNDGWHQARGAEPTTHIFKPGVAGVRGQGLNEHLTMTAARLLGLDAVETRYDEFDGEPAIVITRYDRGDVDASFERQREGRAHAQAVDEERDHERKRRVIHDRRVGDERDRAFGPQAGEQTRHRPGERRRLVGLEGAKRVLATKLAARRSARSK